jgi:hypothetical protein
MVNLVQWNAFLEILFACHSQAMRARSINSVT